MKRDETRGIRVYINQNTTIDACLRACTHTNARGLTYTTEISSGEIRRGESETYYFKVVQFCYKSFGHRDISVLVSK